MSPGACEDRSGQHDAPLHQPFGEQQTVGVEETAAALEEITTTVKDETRRPGGGSTSQPRKAWCRTVCRCRSPRCFGQATDFQIRQRAFPHHWHDRRNRLPDQARRRATVWPAKCGRSTSFWPSSGFRKAAMLEAPRRYDLAPQATGQQPPLPAR